MALSDSKAPLRTVKRVQFGILSPDEIVSLYNIIYNIFLNFIILLNRLILLIYSPFSQILKKKTYFYEFFF